VSVGTGSGLSFKLYPKIPSGGEILYFWPEKFSIKLLPRHTEQTVPNTTFSSFFYYPYITDSTGSYREFSIDAKTIKDYTGKEVQEHLAALSKINGALVLQGDQITYSVRLLTANVERRGTEVLNNIRMTLREDKA
jgi:hypothetical protein